MFVGQRHTPEEIVRYSKRFGHPRLSKKKKINYIILNHLYYIWWFHLIRQICYYHWKREKWPSKLVPPCKLCSKLDPYNSITSLATWTWEKYWKAILPLGGNFSWSVKWSRNKLIFENTSPYPYFFQLYQSHKANNLEPPSTGWLKFNFDLASPSKGSFIASVNRDSSGTITSIITTSESTNSLAWAEAKAALLAVNTTKDIGCNLFIFFKGMQSWFLTALTTHPYLQARKWAHFRWLYRNAMSTTFS